MESLTRVTAVPEPGTGACAEAQPDGVPCACLGTDCETCAQRRDADLAGPSVPAGRDSVDVQHA